MHRKNVMKAVTACACALSGTAMADVGVELRVVPRLGFSAVLSEYESVYDLAVQARVTSPSGAYGLAAFAFNIHVLDEPENAGMLSRDGISLFNGRYDPEIHAFDSVGMSGLARQYSYLANLNTSFNGCINFSRGSFTNGPDQEIGLIAGSASSVQLMSTPGIDADRNGLPDTNPLSSSIMATYFGAGEFADIYRFQYAAQRNDGRTLSFRLESVAGVQVFTGLQSSSGYWATAGLISVSGGGLTLSGLDIRALPEPASCVGLGLWLTLARRGRRQGK